MALVQADVPLDWPQTCGKLDVGPRKLRTSDGQASDAEILTSAPRRLSRSRLSIGRPLQSQFTTIGPRIQATRLGTSSLKPTDYNLGPVH